MNAEEIARSIVADPPLIPEVAPNQWHLARALLVAIEALEKYKFVKTSPKGGEFAAREALARIRSTDARGEKTRG